MTKGILIVSMGTKHLEALENTTMRLEQRAAKMFPDYIVYHAFSSHRILNIMNSMGQGTYYNITETLEKMEADGIEEVLIQPAFILNGIEHDRLQEKTAPFHGRFKRLRIGKPLLSEHEDYKKTIHAVMSEVDLKEDEVLILVGRGTDHHSNSAYPALEYTAHMLGYTQVMVGTIDGFPNFQNVYAKLQVSGYKKVRLLPFLFVVGNNVQKSIAAETDSWRSKLIERGYEAEAVLKSLGEMEGIQALFLEHLEDLL